MWEDIPRLGMVAPVSDGTVNCLTDTTYTTRLLNFQTALWLKQATSVGTLTMTQQGFGATLLAPTSGGNTVASLCAEVSDYRVWEKISIFSKQRLSGMKQHCVVISTSIYQIGLVKFRLLARTPHNWWFIFARWYYKYHQVESGSTVLSPPTANFISQLFCFLTNYLNLNSLNWQNSKPHVANVAHIQCILVGVS